MDAKIQLDVILYAKTSLVWELERDTHHYQGIVVFYKYIEWSRIPPRNGACEAHTANVMTTRPTSEE